MLQTSRLLAGRSVGSMSEKEERAAVNGKRSNELTKSREELAKETSDQSFAPLTTLNTRYPP